MLKPLSQWYCDSCGEVIETPKQGWLEWVAPYPGKASGFHICHHRSSSPRSEGCYQHTGATGRSDGHLEWWSGGNAQPFLLGFLNGGHIHAPKDGPADFKSVAEFVELSRRLTVPYYEEARRYWRQAESDGLFSDMDGAQLYGQEFLKGIISDYSKRG